MNAFFDSTFGIVVFVIAILVLREVVTWYFKLNRITRQNAEIIRLLSKLAHEPEQPTDAEKLGQTIGRILTKVKTKNNVSVPEG
jgi:hypothetical protein